VMARRRAVGFRRRTKNEELPWAGGRVSWRAAQSWLKVVARLTARRMAVANGVKRRTAPRQLSKTVPNTSDELTVLYSNGTDDRSVKLALGYVTAATSGC
jgi:hypothetical protein